MAQIAKRKKAEKQAGKEERLEQLQNNLIAKCCNMVESSLRMASIILKTAHLDVEALITVMVLVNASFISRFVRLYEKEAENKLIESFLDEIRIEAKNMIKEDSVDKNAN